MHGLRSISAMIFILLCCTGLAFGETSYYTGEMEILETSGGLCGGESGNKKQIERVVSLEAGGTDSASEFVRCVGFKNTRASFVSDNGVHAEAERLFIRALKICQAFRNLILQGIISEL